MRTVLIASLLALALAGCAKQVEAPDAEGVCWTMSQSKDGKVAFNKLAANVPNMEHCAAALEAVRLRFLSLGGTHYELNGAYQGQFIFVRREGVFSSPTLEGIQYLALVRSGDGRLVVPGAVAQ